MKRKLFVKKILLFLLFFIIIIVFIFLDLKAYSSLKEKAYYHALAKYMSEKSSSDLSCNEDKTSSEQILPQKTEKMLKLEELHTQNSDIVAWLEIPETAISYPVLLTNNNSFYLNHSYNKSYSAMGSLFLDKDTDLNRPSENFLIYGHRNQSGAMFEDLLKYESENFYQKHKKVHFTTLSEDAEYEIISAFRSKVYYQTDTNVFRYYYFVNAKDKKDFDNYVQSAKAVSMYDTGISAEYHDSLITLSTCAYHTEDGRFAVVARKKTDN